LVNRDLLTKVGLLEHRVTAIKLALEGATLADGVRAVLFENLRVAEEALRFAKERALAGDEERARLG
jgi:hypothetical protein